MAVEKRSKKADKSVKTKSLILTESSPFAIKEAYKALRTNVTFSLPGTESRCIGITSSDRAEGKSTNAINLAIAFSQIGKRVVLVDCDLRLPTIAAKLNVPGRPGLSNLLVGEARANDVLNHYAENLDIIPAGQIPRDPTGLLVSDFMGKFIAKLKEVYDYVIIDLPPVTKVTDAAILSKHIDGFLLVVRHENSHYGEISEMLRQLNLAEARILGFIYNDAPIEGKKNYYYYG